MTSGPRKGPFYFEESGVRSQNGKKICGQAAFSFDE